MAYPLMPHDLSFVEPSNGSVLIFFFFLHIVEITFNNPNAKFRYLQARIMTLFGVDSPVLFLIRFSLPTSYYTLMPN